MNIHKYLPYSLKICHINISVQKYSNYDKFSVPLSFFLITVNLEDGLAGRAFDLGSSESEIIERTKMNSGP